MGSFGADSTSCKISRVFTKRQVNKVKTMDIYLWQICGTLYVFLLEEKFSGIYFISGPQCVELILIRF